MNKAATSRRVIKIARDLSLNGDGDNVDQIIAYCLAIISRWTESEDVTTITRLEELACQRLNLEFEEIHEDADIERLVKKYVAQKEFAFAGIRSNFDGETFGTTFIRCNDPAGSPKRYVAFIDCRGEKYHRRFFTRWHEIAHLLTNPPVASQPVNRSTIARCPVEQLMDKIASVVGFYDPIFRPAMLKHAEGNCSLTFEIVEAIRNRYCPVASFQATLIACVQRIDVPAVYVEAGMGYKNEEKKKVFTQQMTFLPDDLPDARLRILQASPNTAARASRLRIDRNMEVPQMSIIAQLFSRRPSEKTVVDLAGIENLSIWEHSDGSRLGNDTVSIEARHLRNRIIAIVTPYE